MLLGPAGLAIPGGPGGMNPGIAGRAAPPDPGPDPCMPAAGGALLEGGPAGMKLPPGGRIPGPIGPGAAAAECCCIG